VIDMRPVKDASATFANAGAVTQALPKNGGIITIGTAKYWTPRTDIISMDPEGNVVVYKGGNSGQPAQGVPSTNLNLHSVSLAPYTTSSRDLVVQKLSNLGYRMTDIERLEDRIGNLENISTLNAAEIQTLKSSVPDPTDSTLPDRVKQGLTADGFNNGAQSAIFDDDYRASILRSIGGVAPLQFVRQVPLKYDSDQSTMTVIKGNTIWPKYTEELMIEQNVASQAVNVNSFEITRSVGAGYLDPNIDTWTIRKKVDESHRAQQNNSFVAAGSISVSSQGEQN